MYPLDALAGTTEIAGGRREIMDPYVRKLEQENFALKTELEQYKEALFLACEELVRCKGSRDDGTRWWSWFMKMAKEGARNNEI